MEGAFDSIASLAGSFWPMAAAGAVAVLLERAAPWRGDRVERALRWMQAGTVYLLGVLLTHLAVPLVAVAASLQAADHGYGLFQHVDAPLWLSFAVSFLALDLGDYLRHRLHHEIGALWRLHRLHHSDTELDASTALRFHPFEAVLTMLVALGIVFALGAPVEAVAAHAAALIALGYWGHADIRTPRLTRLLLPVLVTPEMHRCHHGDAPGQMQANYGVIFSVWDRLFGTYSPPQEQLATLRFGLGPGSGLGFERLGDMLADPLRRDPADVGTRPRPDGPGAEAHARATGHGRTGN